MPLLGSARSRSAHAKIGHGRSTPPRPGKPLLRLQPSHHSYFASKEERTTSPRRNFHVRGRCRPYPCKGQPDAAAPRAADGMNATRQDEQRRGPPSPSGAQIEPAQLSRHHRIAVDARTPYRRPRSPVAAASHRLILAKPPATTRGGERELWRPRTCRTRAGTRCVFLEAGARMYY